MLQRIFHLARALIVVVFFSGGESVAQDAGADAYYRGKTARIYVGYGVGGGYDLYARMIAPHLAAELGATVIVENLPGAGGLTALNKLYGAEPDGLTMMIVNGAAAGLSQIIEQEAVRYDLTRVSHLGTLSQSPWVWIARPGMAEQTVDNFISAQPLIRWGGTGTIDGSSDGSAVICEALQLRCKIIKAYKGSSEIALALARGEMDALYITDLSARAYIEAGQAVAVATLARTRSRHLPETPTIFEVLTLSPEQTFWLDFRTTLESLGRILVAPPKIPADRLTFLQMAVERALRQPALVAQGEKAQRPIDLATASETLERTQRVISRMTSQQKAKVKTVVLDKFL